MVCASRLGCQQQEHEVDGFVVDGLEIDRILEPGEQAEDAFQLRQLGMWNGDALPDAGRAQALALEQGVEYRALIDAKQIGRAADISCRTCFLLLALSDETMPSGVMKSPSSIAICFPSGFALRRPDMHFTCRPPL